MNHRTHEDMAHLVHIIDLCHLCPILPLFERFMNTLFIETPEILYTSLDISLSQ